MNSCHTHPLAGECRWPWKSVGPNVERTSTRHNEFGSSDVRRCGLWAVGWIHSFQSCGGWSGYGDRGLHDAKWTMWNPSGLVPLKPRTLHGTGQNCSISEFHDESQNASVLFLVESGGRLVAQRATSWCVPLYGLPCFHGTSISISWKAVASDSGVAQCRLHGYLSSVRSAFSWCDVFFFDRKSAASVHRSTGWVCSKLGDGLHGKATWHI